MDRRTMLKKIGRSLLVAVFWLAVWYALSAWVDKELLLPGPLLVLRRGWQLALSGEFWLAALATLARVVAGFALGLVSGALLAVLCFSGRWLNSLLSPLIQAVRAAPVASFIILALVWLSTSRIPIFISALMVLPVAWGNVLAGLEATDPKLLEMARLFRVPKGVIARRIYWPSLDPYLWSAAATGLGLAWKSGVTAEIIAGPLLAVGSELRTARVSLETADVFVWTLVVIALSLLLEALLKRVASRRDAHRGKEANP